MGWTAGWTQELTHTQVQVPPRPVPTHAATQPSVTLDGSLLNPVPPPTWSNRVVGVVSPPAPWRVVEPASSGGGGRCTWQTEVQPVGLGLTGGHGDTGLESSMTWECTMVNTVNH